MDDPTTVRSLLDAAHFAPDQAELDEFVKTYPRIAAMVASLYSVEAARYEFPALHFDPDPAFEDWV